MSANFLGREKGYREVIGFGEGSTSIAEAFSPASTYADRIGRLFEEVAAMGYKGIDLWLAHCHPRWVSKQHVDGLLSAASRYDIEIASLAGGGSGDFQFIGQVCRLAHDIGCPTLGMGCAFLPDQIGELQELLESFDLQMGFENHPDEQTPEMLLTKVAHGTYSRVGCTFDTGWWATNNYPALQALDLLKDCVFHVHLKNIEAPGDHIAAPWDTGCVDLESVVRRLREIDYAGWMSYEYEPLDRDPTDNSREFLKKAAAWWNNPNPSAPI